MFGALSGAAALITITALAGNSTPSGRTTNFQPPQFVSNPADCVWAWTNNHPPQQQTKVDDPPTDEGSTDSYAETIAWGMQVQAYGWAWDGGWSDASATAASSDAGGNVVLRNVSVPPQCTTLITGDWKPKMRLRTEVNPPGTVTVHGKMKGDTMNLNIHVLVDASLSQDGTASISTVQIGPWGAPVVTNHGGGAREINPNDYGHDQKPLTQDTAFYSCNTDVYVFADSTIVNWVGEVEGFVWESLAGLDLHGNCPTTCQGYGYIVYNWY